MAVVIETTVGDFTVDLFTDQRPQTCRNFLKLCKIKYYNWSLFHSVQTNFIAQTGDPTGTGKGGESVYGIVLGETARYYEAEQMPKIKHDRTGLISMVNCGNNMLGSQFFITLGSELQSLDGEHCVFGEITEGLEVVLKFNEAICDGDFRPYQDIRISHTVILEDPYEDPKGLIVPDKSPERTNEALLSDRIGADEAIDDTAGMTAEEIIEMRKEREAKARATILEIVGDLPDADMAPPENVLFVCKLNPVTGDDDLEIIFSRFGKIVGCEVIRDRQSGDSLQYAFIEFADRKSCEEAYFKMDNVLIDDRRIHVDFSQSVSKMRWRGKGKGIQYYDDKEKVNQNYNNSKETDNKNGREKRGQEQFRDRERKCSLREESERKRHQQDHKKDTTVDETHRKNFRNNDRRSRDKDTSSRNFRGRNDPREQGRNDPREQGRNDPREQGRNMYNKGRIEIENRRRKEDFDRDRPERNFNRDDNWRGRDRRDNNRYNNNENRGNFRDRRYREDMERNKRIPNNARRHEERKERIIDRWEENQRRKIENERRYRNDGDGQPMRHRNEDTRNKNGREHMINDRKKFFEENLRDRPKESVIKDVQKSVRNREKEFDVEKHGSKSRRTKSSSSSDDSSSDTDSDSSSESDQKRRNSKKKLKKRKHDTTSDDSSESDEPSSKIRKKKRHKDVSDSDDSDEDEKKATKKKAEIQDKKKQKSKKKQSSYDGAKQKLKSKEKKGEEGKKKPKNKKTKKTRVSSSSESSSSSSSSDSSDSDSPKKKRKSTSAKSKKAKKSKKSKKQSESSSSSSD